MAAYFPRGQKEFAEIQKKFNDDLVSVAKNNVVGFVFVTNQELRLAERQTLKTAAGKIEVDLFHLERLTLALDKPSMAGIREQFLSIPATGGGGVKTVSSRRDRILFDKFCEVLPSGGRSIRFLKTHDMGGSFHADNLIELETFEHEWNDAEHEFLNIELECQRKKLFHALDSFLEAIALHTFPGRLERNLTMDMDDLETRPEKWAIYKKLNSLATTVWDEHQSLVRLGRSHFPAA